MPSLYNYALDPITNTHNFVTKNNILYRVALLVDHTFSTVVGEEIKNVFQLVVEKATAGLEPLDSRVFKTIEDIVADFFKDVNKSVIYFCSDNDNRANLRLKVFELWYQKSNYNTVIMKRDSIIKSELEDGSVHEIHASFMFHKDNPNRNRLEPIWTQMEAFLNRDK